jgi:hypothetical protein
MAPIRHVSRVGSRDSEHFAYQEDDMKACSALTIACAIAASASGALAQNYGKVIYPFSIRDGETLVLRRVTSTTNSCAPLFIKVEGIDALEAPAELSFKAENERVTTSTGNGKDCEKPVPGAVVYVTAKGVAERKEADVVLRVRMETKNGPWQNTIRSHVLLFPAEAQAAPSDKAKQ